MTKEEYRVDLALRCFGMLVLKEGRPKPTADGTAIPKQVRDACAQESFNYADSFLEACVKQGAKPWEQ